MTAPTQPRSVAAIWLARLLLVVVPPMLLFAAAELALWIAEVPRLSDNKAFQQHEFMRDCRAEPELIERFCDIDRADEPEEITSVFVFGGSSVQGYPLGKMRPFPSFVQTMLEKRHPGQYRVHNLGVACRDSIYIRKCAATARGDGSDIYVIYAGHNDFANFMVARPKLRIFSEEHPRLFAFESTLAKSRSYSLLSDLVQGKPRSKMAAWNRLPNPQWGVSREITLDQYIRNITHVVEQAAELGVEVVLVTVVSNVSEYPATKEGWQKLLNRERPFPEYLQPWREHFKNGVELYEAGEWEASLREFKAARDDSMGGRAPTALNEFVRSLAARHDHVHLVDFERSLDRIGLEEGHGCAFFGEDDWCDQFHPNHRTNRLIAREVVAQLERMRGGD